MVYLLESLVDICPVLDTASAGWDYFVQKADRISRMPLIAILFLENSIRTLVAVRCAAARRRSDEASMAVVALMEVLSVVASRRGTPFRSAKPSGGQH